MTGKLHALVVEHHILPAGLPGNKLRGGSACWLLPASKYTVVNQIHTQLSSLYYFSSDQRLQDYSDRLTQVENTLRALVDQQVQDAMTTSLGPSSTSIQIPRDSNSWKERADFEGDSSFVTHSKHATQAVEEILNTTPYSDSGREALAAVARLKDVLSKGEAFSEGSVISNNLFHDVIEYPELARLPLPPTDIVLQLLRHVKGISLFTSSGPVSGNNHNLAHRQRFFYDMITIDEQYITDLCQKVFFAIEEYSIAVFITVHVSLFYLFRDLPIQEARMMNLSSTELGKIVSICGTNASIAVKHLRLSMEATHENIEALWFAVSPRLVIYTFKTLPC